MVERKVELTADQDLGLIIIDNPPYNLLSSDVIDGIDQALDELEENAKIRSIILTGAGDCFSYGADIKEISGVKDTILARDLCIRGHTVFHRFWTSSVPTIAALNGKCLGGGLEVALACHFRVADEGIRIGFPEIRLGLIPGWGGTQRMVRLSGPSVTLDYVLTGKMMDPKRAMELGIINEISPPGEALKIARRMSRRFSRKSSRAVKEALDVVTRGIEMDLTDALKHEAEGFGRLRETDEAEKGLEAFFEGRRPRFTKD